MEDHEQCAARQQQLWEFHLCCLFYPSLLCSLHIWRYLSLGCHHQDSYVKNYLLFGGLEKFFFRKKISFQGLPFILSSAASISLWAVITLIQWKGLLVIYKSMIHIWQKVPSFGDKNVVFLGAKRNIILGITQLYPLLCSLHISLGCHHQDCDCQWEQSHPGDPSLVIPVVIVVVVVDHLEGPASCKWSSGGTGFLQMIICHSCPD